MNQTMFSRPSGSASGLRQIAAGMLIGALFTIGFTSTARQNDPTGACTTNARCDADSFCKKKIGDCDGVGECAKKPLACPAIYNPVCGCDGITYSNACYAHASGVNIAFTGVCPDQPCFDNTDCPFGFYCKKNPGDCQGPGICTEMPQGCPDIWDPVCGCDGQTYSNACDAAANGISIAYAGKCLKDPACKDNCDCPEGFYCFKPLGQCGGEGICLPKPQGCPEIYDPVCGCDGQTYSNACEAAAAGVNVKFKGPCPSGCVGDLNHDGKVDGADLGILLANWGICN